MTERENWIVLTKIDELEEQQLEVLCDSCRARFPDRKVFAISAMADLGLQQLKEDVMAELASMGSRMKDDSEYQEKITRLEKRIREDVLMRSNIERGAIRNAKSDKTLDDVIDDEPEVVYVKE